MLKRFLLGLLVVWAAAGLLAEMSTALSSYDRRAQPTAFPAWRFGAPEPRRLARCLQEARQAMPPGSIVAFASPDVPPGAAFERWRWAAFLLPDYDVVPADDPAALAVAQYAIACDRRPAIPGAEPIRRLPSGRLYRVRRP